MPGLGTAAVVPGQETALPSDVTGISWSYPTNFNRITCVLVSECPLLCVRTFARTMALRVLLASSLVGRSTELAEITPPTT